MAKSYVEEVAAVQSQMRPGGRPAHKYLELQAQRWEGVGAAKAAALTTQMMKNYENRIVAIENRLGMAFEMEPLDA